MVMDGESSLPASLIPEINSPSAQFLSESLTLHPSCRVHDFLDVPPEPAADEFELTLTVPSKFEQ
jgi:hypothetical protein